MMAAVVLGRGIIIITGPPCQSRSGCGRMVVVVVVKGVKSHLVPKICPGLQTDCTASTARVMMRK